MKISREEGKSDRRVQPSFLFSGRWSRGTFLELGAAKVHQIFRTAKSIQMLHNGDDRMIYILHTYFATINVLLVFSLDGVYLSQFFNQVSG